MNKSVDEKKVPVVIGSTGEQVGTAIILPSDNGKIYARVTIYNSKLLKEHNGLIKLLFEDE